MDSFATKTPPHPLDPIRVDEVREASQTLLKHLGRTTNEIRFKVVDLAEPSKALTLEHLYNNGSAPDRRGRIYFHRKDSQVLSIAIVNISKSRVENVYDAPDSQGPVDWIEFELVHKACLEHPDVLAEVNNLKLPKK